VEKNDIRVVLRLHPVLAPFKCAVLPLSKKLSPEAEKIAADLRKNLMVDYDDSGSIGKRYRRQDEIGTPYCLTYDFESENDKCVTVRDRDSMTQERILIDDVNDYIREKLIF
jgi:glycyl-tRNA synthetase